MKRNYISPESQCITLATEQLIATSEIHQIELSETELGAEESYSNEQDLWGNEDIWK